MKTVFVGLSGGVDSAVSAFLLREKGFRVVGAFIKGWEPDFLPCTGVRDRLEAMRVAAHLRIPFITYDLEEEYKRGVVDYFVSEYGAGRTPNPDVVCNRTIKFGAFWERAKADGADYIATGHYAVNAAGGNGHELRTSHDKEKDQTYFLWTLSQEDLTHSLFPVGEEKKEDVRSIAAKAGLPNAARPDSQGLCFLGHVDMQEFLKRYLKIEKGPVLDEQGKTIGEHDGAVFYTIGQHISLGGMAERLYVISKDVEKNSLRVSSDPIPEKSGKRIRYSGAHWILGEIPSGEILSRSRYRGPLLPTAVEPDGHISFQAPQRIAPGQSVVFYDEDGKRCLGGAIAEASDA